MIVHACFYFEDTLHLVKFAFCTMSGLLGKTIESLNSLLAPLNSSMGLSPKFMYERCLSARTKREEEWVFEDSLRLIRERLSEPGVRTSTVKKSLAFVVFAEMMGYKAEFAYIHAVKLTQQGSFSEKKMGYMVCVQLLRDSNPLSMLLVNTVIRDLASRNIVTIAMALSASCHLIPPDQASSILPMVADKLTHSNEYIRGKAVIVLHHFLRISPTNARHYMHRVRSLLGDSDPGVVALVLQYLLYVSQEHPDYGRDLWQSVVSVQEQILNGHLPKDYLRHGISAPWTQVTIIKLLRHLHPPLADVQSILQDTLLRASNGSNTNSGLAAAISIECLSTLLQLSSSSSEILLPVNQVTPSAMTVIGHLLTSPNTNFRYEGLGLLETLIAHQRISLTHEQQAVIFRCLQHPDSCIKLKTLHLLCTIADSNNAEAICNQVIDYLKNHCSNSHVQQELITKSMLLIEKFPSCGNHWHLASSLRLLPLAAQQTSVIQACIKCSLFPGANSEKENVARKKVLSYLKRHSENKVAPTSILELYVWAISVFHHLLENDGSEPNNVATHIIALNHIVSLGEKVLDNQLQGALEIVPFEIHNLLLEIITAVRNLIIANGESVPKLQEFLNKIISATTKRVFGNAGLRFASEELLQMLPSCEELKKNTDIEVNKADELDFTLSFMDDFVCDDLKENCLPYIPLPVRTSTRTSIQMVLEIERKRANICLESSSLLGAHCSLGSSELSLAGTENSRVESDSPVSSTDSKCWTYTSPTQDISLTPVWTKEGRVKGDAPSQESLQTDSSKTLPPKETCKPMVASLFQKNEAIDPLDELQNELPKISNSLPSTHTSPS